MIMLTCKTCGYNAHPLAAPGADAACPRCLTAYFPKPAPGEEPAAEAPAPEESVAPDESGAPAGVGAVEAAAVKAPPTLTDLPEVKGL